MADYRRGHYDEDRTRVHHPGYPNLSLQSTYVPVDPFRPSLAFSLKNILTRRREETTIDNVPLPASSHVLQSLRHPRVRETPYLELQPQSTHINLPPPHELHAYPSRSARSTSPRRKMRPVAKELGISSPEPSTSAGGRPSIVRDSRHLNADRESRSRSRSRHTFGVPGSSVHRNYSPTHHRHRPSRSPERRSQRSGRDSGSPRRSQIDRPVSHHSGKGSQDRTPYNYPDIHLPSSPSHSSSTRDVIGRRAHSPASRHASPIADSRSGRRSRSPIEGRRRHRRPIRSTSPLDPALHRMKGEAHTHYYLRPPRSLSSIPVDYGAVHYGSVQSSQHNHSPVRVLRNHPPVQPEHDKSSAPELVNHVLAFVLDTMPRQVYLHLLLRLPYLYFSRVTRIFEEAEMSMPEIKKMALEATSQWNDPTRNLPKTWNFEPKVVSPPYENLQRSWSLFIDSLMREWKTLNIISVLLLSAILTFLQIESAANDPLTRYTALLSMICALMSLLYGCMYIIRFGTMRTTYKAAEWAQEAQKSRTGILWNVWVLLAMPAIWLAWSMVLYIVCIMSFVWRTGTVDDDSRGPITRQDARIPRIVISVVLSLGVLYFVLIASTLRRYGDAMDRAWRTRIIGWMHEKVDVGRNRFSHYGHSNSRVSTNAYVPSSPPRNNRPPTIVEIAPDFMTFEDKPSGRPTTEKPLSESGPSQRPSQPLANSKIQIKKILGLCSSDALAHADPYPFTLETAQMKHEDWLRLSTEIRAKWSVDQPTNIQDIIDHWNTTFFNERGGQIRLCEEFGIPWLKHALFYFSSKDGLPHAKARYDSIPESLQRLDIWTSLLAPGDIESRIRKIHLYSSHLKIDADLLLSRESLSPGPGSHIILPPDPSNLNHLAITGTVIDLGESSSSL
ncbi:hypothetical protein B0H34DRAFT_803176 [Crassisporium funariophilum]|nr:hypothetical protein B0H34DRAFT_803176 [Crassisporium funariophilum]